VTCLAMIIMSTTQLTGGPPVGQEQPDKRGSKKDAAGYWACSHV
jgi:hypothetical protein